VKKPRDDDAAVILWMMVGLMAIIVILAKSGVVH
tara:strand:+ start:2997 stop:3098 length:102 start_codon:yes stop_codon:yes gene_type:complete